MQSHSDGLFKKFIIFKNTSNRYILGGLNDPNESTVVSPPACFPVPHVLRCKLCHQLGVCSSGLHAVPGLALVLASRGSSLAVVLGRLIVVASLVVERRLPWSWRLGPIVLAQRFCHELGCSVACGIFEHQGLNLCPLPW